MGRMDPINNGDTIIFKSCHGTYLRAKPEGEVDLANEPKECENWSYSFVMVGEKNKLVLKSCHGTYLRAGLGKFVNLAKEPKNGNSGAYFNLIMVFNKKLK